VDTAPNAPQHTSLERSKWKLGDPLRGNGSMRTLSTLDEYVADLRRDSGLPPSSAGWCRRRPLTA